MEAASLIWLRSCSYPVTWHFERGITTWNAPEDVAEFQSSMVFIRLGGFFSPPISGFDGQPQEYQSVRLSAA
jgi:hypothetical protein